MSATHDVFGIKKIYKDKGGGPQWDSRHWDNGFSRTIKSGSKDPDDPTQCSENRGNVTWDIDGNGLLIFNGTKSDGGRTEPRFHLNKPEQYFFRDVECTFYIMRVKDDNTNWGGACLGVRSGPNGHSYSNEYCDAHTYYQRMRHDGYRDFEKELKHPQSSVKDRSLMWPSNGKFPYNKWIGYKSVTRNAGNGVKLQLFVDTTEGANGGTWTKLGEVGDVHSWAPPQVAPQCDYPSDFVPLEGGGVIVLRNTGVTECMYKWMTVREITSSYVLEENNLNKDENDLIVDNDEFEIIEGECCTTDLGEESTGCIHCEGGNCPISRDETNNNHEEIKEEQGWISYIVSLATSLY